MEIPQQTAACRVRQTILWQHQPQRMPRGFCTGPDDEIESLQGRQAEIRDTS